MNYVACVAFTGFGVSVFHLLLLGIYPGFGCGFWGESEFRKVAYMGWGYCSSLSRRYGWNTSLEMESFGVFSFT
jgi:hypothetical protein